MLSLSEIALYALASVGAIVVAYVGAMALGVLVGIAFWALEMAFDRLSGVAWNRGNGRSHLHHDGERHPDAPWDRLWIEALYLKSVFRWAQCRIGFSRWRRPFPSRPDIGRLHELREERGADE